MAKLYNITLTSTSPPTTGYTIYYNSVNAATIATKSIAGGPATNLTKAQLVFPGLKVSVPDTATSIIMYNIECASSANFTVPTSVTITASASNIHSTSLTLNWITAPSGIATSYLIFKDGVLLTTLGNVSSYEVSGLIAGVTYNFSVQGKDIVGNVVGISNSVIVSLPVNDVVWTGDEYIVSGGDPSGGFTELNGTVEIIGSPVTFRAYVFIPDVIGGGSASTGINIDGVTRYVDIISPPNEGNAYSTTFTLPAGKYNWQVIFSWMGDAGSGGEGGIDWTQ